MQVYTIYSILCIVFIILVIVTAFITIALTYFQLAVEDHRWWWRSFLCGGSTGLALLCKPHPGRVDITLPCHHMLMIREAFQWLPMFRSPMVTTG